MPKKTSPTAYLKTRRRNLQDLCIGCDKLFSREEMTPNENGSLRCPNCIGTRKRVKKEKPAGHLWYVMQVEPGYDGKAKKDLLRRLRIEGDSHLVKKAVIPRLLKDDMVAPAGMVMDTGTEETHKDAFRAGEAEALRLLGWTKGAEEPQWREHYRLTIHHDEKTGKYVWKVRTKEPAEYKTIAVKKFPGYVLLHALWGKELDNYIGKTRYSWGLLLRPVVKDLKTEVTKSQRKGGGWLWKVRTANLDAIVARGRKDSESGAWEAAKSAKASLEEFRPTALKTQEAAELLIAHTAVSQIMRDKQEMQKRTLAFKPGHEVEILEGVWKGNKEAVVSKIDTTDKTKPVVWVTVKMWGNPVTVEIPHHSLKRK
jgi:transcription antitermination factor NusG